MKTEMQIGEWVSGPAFPAFYNNSVLMQEAATPSQTS